MNLALDQAPDHHASGITQFACVRLYAVKVPKHARAQAMSEKSQERLDAHDSSQIERQLLPRFHFSSLLDVLYCQYVGQDTFQKKNWNNFFALFLLTLRLAGLAGLVILHQRRHKSRRAQVNCDIADVGTGQVFAL